MYDSDTAERLNIPEQLGEVTENRIVLAIVELANPPAEGSGDGEQGP